MTQIFIFDKDDNLRLVLEPKTHVSPDKVERPLIYVNGVYVEELNGQETLEFEVPYTENDNDVAWIEGGGRAVIRNQDGDFVEFIIRQVDDRDSLEGLVKRVFCESAEYELNDEYLTGYAPDQPVTLRTALEALLQGTRFEAGEVMASEARNVNIGTMSVKAGITELLTIFGGEKRVRVEVLGNRITRRFIDILSRRGTFTGKRFEFGKDIQQIKREVDYTEIKTALYGFGESTENDGPRVDFADVVWSKANGDPVDKPAGQLWVGDPEALARYGYDGGTRHRFGVYESQASDPGQLLLETWEELQRRSQPTVTYELDVIMLENLTGWDHEQVRLGDGVYVIDRHMRPTAAIEEYVIRIEHYLNDPTRSRVLLGNFRDSFFAEIDRLRAIEKPVIGRGGKKVARFVIGTSTAGWTKNDIDYLCDGVDDQEEINQAIQALPASGGEIVILDGTYNITAPIRVNKSNVSIKGNGNATVLKRMWNSGPTEAVITLIEVSNCKIENLQIDGNKSVYTSLINYGILLYFSNNNTITGNTCNNNHIGIYLSSSNNNTITGNTCNDNKVGMSSAGIYLASGSNNNTITGNTCNNNSYGILLSSSNNNTITGNTCLNNNDSGIYLNSSNNNDVTGNTCNNNSTGIYLTINSDNNTVTGNTCNNNSTGIYILTNSHNTITGNTCNNNSTGIYLSLSSHNNTITGNTCNSNSNNGIYLFGGDNNTITGNTCNNNSYGIQLSSSDNNTITGNTSNNNSTGIYLSFSNNNAITGNTCIRGTGQSSDYTSSQYTIRLAGSDNNYNLISSNNCIGKDVVIGGGTSNTSVNNKYN